MYKWLEFRRAAISLFLPNRCPFCNCVIGMWEYWCESCYSKLHVIEEQQTAPANADMLLTCCYYSGRARSAVVRLKRGYYSYASDAFAVLMTELAGDIIPQVDCITAVPASWKRRIELGGDHAEFIAKGTAESSGKPLRRMLGVTRGKKEQKHLSIEERFENAANGYKIINNKYIKDSIILLVDDVITTGATISSIAALLKSHGAKAVYALTFAKTKYVDINRFPDDY